jgi:lipoprotein-releasing system permease protein
MIGELRALGFRRADVVRVFFFRALFIVLRGVAWGVVLGVTISLVQYVWHIVPLPSEGYLLSFVPISLCWVEWLIAVVGTIAVIMLVMVLPALYTARISPAETMKYE